MGIKRDLNHLQVEFPLQTRTQVVESVKTDFVPDVFDFPSKDSCEYLMYVSSITQNMTQPSHQALLDFPPKAAKYLNPFAYFADDGEVLWDPDVQELQHMPLLSVGDERNNQSFGRISVQHTEPGTLWISFRPFLLEDVFDMFKKDWYGLACGFVTGREQALSSTMSGRNLLDVLQNLANKQIDFESGVSSGYCKLIERDSTSFTVENNFVAMSKDAAFRPHMQGVLRDYKHKFLVPNNTMTSIKTIVGDFISSYQPKKVVFCGFSLGGGTAVAAAVLVHPYLASKGVPLPDFHAVSFAGTMPGGPQMRDYVDTHFRSCVYLGLKSTDKAGRKVTDPVTFMPFSSLSMQMGQCFYLDYVDRHILPCEPIRGYESRLDWMKLIGCYLGDKPDWTDVSWGFHKIHLPGEDLILRLLAWNMLDARMRSKLLNHIPCRFFTYTGTAAKYKVCPLATCQIDESVVNGKVRASCMDKEVVEPDRLASGRKRRKR